jgi:hypothetical protein
MVLKKTYNKRVIEKAGLIVLDPISSIYKPIEEWESIDLKKEPFTYNYIIFSEKIIISTTME